jgi:hypothetical protein
MRTRPPLAVKRQGLANRSVRLRGRARSLGTLNQPFLRVESDSDHRCQAEHSSKGSCGGAGNARRPLFPPGRLPLRSLRPHGPMPGQSRLPCHVLSAPLPPGARTGDPPNGKSVAAEANVDGRTSLPPSPYRIGAVMIVNVTRASDALGGFCHNTYFTWSVFEACGFHIVSGGYGPLQDFFRAFSEARDKRPRHPLGRFSAGGLTCRRNALPSMGHGEPWRTPTASHTEQIQLWKLSRKTCGSRAAMVSQDVASLSTTHRSSLTMASNKWNSREAKCRGPGRPTKGPGIPNGPDASGSAGTIAPVAELLVTPYLHIRARNVPLGFTSRKSARKP